MRALGIAAVAVLAIVANPAMAQKSYLDDLVLYAMDADTHELLRYEFDTDTFVRLGVVKDQSDNVVMDVEGLAYIPNGIHKGLYGAANYYENEPSRLVRINPIDATAVRLPQTIGFGKVESLVAVPGAGGPVTNVVVTDGLLAPQQEFAAKITVLGSSLTSSGWGYEYQVGVRVVIGDDQTNPANFHEPWGPFDEALASNVQDDNNPRIWTAPGTFPAGTEVGIVGRSWNLVDPGSDDGSQEDHWEIYTTHESWGGTDRVMVLRDGDPVPDVPGGGGQPSVEDYVEDYVDKTTTPYTMDLKPNQVIYAIELGKKPVTHDNTDYQDLVVLVELYADPLSASFPLGLPLLAGSRYSVEVNGSGNYPGDEGSCLLMIDPATGEGTAFSIGTKRYQGLALGHDGTIYGVTKDPADLWTIEPNPADVYDQVETKVGTMSGYEKCEALEFAFGDNGPRVHTAPAAPDAWSLFGALFGFDDDTDSFLIIDPATANTRLYDCAFKTIDAEGLVFLTKNKDPYGQITVNPND